ncbi:MAG: ParB/RepB/Spo0J family partition protein [Thermoanaerobaculum sp.]|nr:ParB/RepB/Spo0J family partition protein [Thermoanaerobaculum sp.]MCX7895535.1 ParB/RepB/Spo0J family partition protein [Thermoanaerobaculum sp.]MDW7967140.1 ParB/RepB/Spo0J family partition protein [Thermoanaerobaculum sp.]
MKRAALGKGLSALLPESGGSGRGVMEIPVTAIRPNPLQPRRHFSDESLAELASSLQKHGFLQPVVVAPAEGGYVLIAGERRWRAAQLAGMGKVPAVVHQADTDGERLALALIENLQREDLTPIEEARAYLQLRSELGLSQEEIAERVGKDRSTIANALRLLSLPLPVQAMVDEGQLSAGHARALAGLADRQLQEELARRCVAEGWSVRELERRLQPKPRKAKPAKDPHTLAAEDRLAVTLGTKVVIQRRRRGGEIRIAFANEAELIRLYRQLTGEDA